MRLSITHAQRKLLLFLSASGYTAWFAGLGEPLHAAESGVSRVAVLTFQPRASLPRIASVIVRDPFAVAQTSRERAASPSRTIQPPSAPGGGMVADETEVPDIGSSGATPSEATALVVRATIAGATPVAYVARGSAMDIVRIGDTLAGRRITTIDLHGIAFDDGSRLDLADAFAPPPRQPQKHALALGIEDLRRLLGPANRATALPAPSPAPLVPVTPAPAQLAYPTPGPLPTVNARGLPVGVNPTPDPYAPTPFPEPYPYAPPPRH
ncbi:MAG: hypothetical protein IAI50_11660 [Candidatus Eremiobacteraeota bacterium]|nr:hypothetical protein [Candidatus Eremiobacteraeota bacterium]